MNMEEMQKYGIDYDKGMQNCMNNEVFYKKIMSMFLSDTCFSRAKIAFDGDNRKELFGCMHEMKGISGNLALTELYAACIPLVEFLRYDGDSREETATMFSAVEKAYDNACLGIRKYLGESDI